MEKSSKILNSDHIAPDGSTKMEEINGDKLKGTSVHRSSSTKSAHMSRTTTLDDFEVVSTIGTGSYGTCKKIRRKRDGKVLVWKELDYGSMTETEKQMLVSEVNLLRELKSPYIVRYYDRIIDRANTTIYIVMEYCKGGDLSTLISRYKREGIYADEELIWKILVQLLLALQECHQRKNGRAVLHRDMKPANVFLDMDNNVKLGDFGLARVLHHETSFANTYVGTPYYMSPELVNSMAYNEKSDVWSLGCVLYELVGDLNVELVNNMAYNEKSDVWSLGCVLYELCALCPPFVASSQTELNKKIRLGEFSRIPLRYSDDLDNTIGKMLHVEVSYRPSIDDLLLVPVVVGHQKKLERKMSGQLQCPIDVKTSASDLSSWQKELEERKRQLDNRERELANKEKLLEEKEKTIALQKKMAEEKYARAESLLQEYDRKMRLETERLLGRDHHDLGADLSDSSGDGLASCLTKKKDPDTPKKKVSFDMYGKENQRFKDRFRDPLLKYTDYDSAYIQDLMKRQELKERLYQVKQRALDYRGTDDRTSRSRNLLLFR